MPRTRAYSALILRSRSSGENNREIQILTAEEGIIRATVFGGPKSRLRSHAEPFHSGTMWIYHDPVRDSRKLSDFDVQSWYPGLRELYERAMTADAIAETILASHGGGGNWETALSQAKQALNVLENANEEFCTRIFIFFLWHWAALLGIQADLEQCGHCGRKSAPDKVMWYSQNDNSLCCPACIYDSSPDPEERPGDRENLIQLSPGSRRWLLTSAALAPQELSRYTMDSQIYRETKLLTQSVLAGALGRKPASWDWF